MVSSLFIMLSSCCFKCSPCFTLFVSVGILRLIVFSASFEIIHFDDSFVKLVSFVGFDFMFLVCLLSLFFSSIFLLIKVVSF